MGMTVDQYKGQLQALLPQGAAWPREAGANLTALLVALADELARVDARCDILIEEADARTTAEMLADWERVAGLPGKCITTQQTTQERRAALVARLTNIGGQSRAYFIALAASLGYTVTITEFRPFQAGSQAGDAITNGVWIFAWQVNSALDTIRTFQAGQGAAGDPLRSWGNQLLECAIRKYAPAHTHVMFAYI